MARADTGFGRGHGTVTRAVAAATTSARTRLADAEPDDVKRAVAAPWPHAYRTPQRFAHLNEDGDGRADCTLVGIKHAEAAWMDPQQLALLQLSAALAADSPDRFARGANTAIYTGVCWSVDLAFFGCEAALSAYAITGRMPSVTSGRLGFAYALTAEAVSVDTACSSALVALHYARESRATAALHGGASLASGTNVCFTTEWLQLGAMKSISADGRCKTFDVAADGFGRAEQTSIVLLTCCNDGAKMDGAFVLAATTVNQDGASVSLTAPNGKAQANLITDALRSLRSPPHTVEFEMHGTGTPLGDPIEANGIKVAAQTIGSVRTVYLASLKSIIGHAEADAGLVGLLNLCQALRGKTCAYLTHLRSLNPHLIRLLKTPARKGREELSLIPHRQPATCEAATIGSCSSFGFSGTNAHAVVTDLLHAPLAQNTVQRIRHHESKGAHGMRTVPAIHLHILASHSSTSSCIHMQTRILTDRFKSPFALFASICQRVVLHTHEDSKVQPYTHLQEVIQHAEMPARIAVIRMARGRISIIAHALEHRSDVAFLATVARFAAPFRVRVAAGARKWTGFCTYQRACTLAKAAESRDLAHRTACVDQTGCARTPHRRLVGAGAIVASVDSAHDDPRAHRIVACGGEARVVNDGGVGALRICEATHHFPHRGGSGPAVSSSFDRACDSLYDTTWHASGAVRASQTAASGTSRASAHLASARALVSLCASAPARTLLGLFCSMQEPIPHPWLLALTRGAVHTHVPGASGCSLASAGMSAAIRSRHLETHDGAWSAVDVSAAANVSARALVCTIRHETAVTDAFSDATVTQSSLLVPVLRRRTMPARHASPLVSPVHHCITGGTGALGRMLASILTAAPTVASVATLLSRSGRGNKGFRAALGSAASTRSVWRASRCDAASIDEYACEVLARRRMPYGPPRISVAHAGGVLADAMLAKHNARSVRTVYAPKVDAAGHIEARAIPAPCVGVTAFSSIAVCIMSMGQANYAGANATLDAWVMRMRTTGVCAASTQWGAWSDVGMATTEKNILKRMERQGILPLPPDQGCLLMEMVIASSTAWMYAGCNASAKLTCTPMCWDTFARTVSSSRYFPVGEEGGVADAPKPTADAAARSAARSAAQGAPSASSLSARRMNIAGVQQAVSAVVQKVADDAIDDHAALMESGVDSLMSTEIRTEVERALSVSLPATVLFDYPTIAELAKYVAGLVGAAGTSSDFAETRVGGKECGAVVGRAAYGLCGALELASEISDECGLSAISKCVDGIGQIGRDHWHPDIVGGPRFAGFMHGIYRFDASAVRISTGEAILMDPQHRRVLSVLFTASPTLRNDDGVFVGNSEAQTVVGRNDESPYAVLGYNPSVACGRVSYLFGLHGPCITVDTACSASTAACHLALMHHRTASPGTQQLIFGVLISGSPQQTLAIQRAGMLSPEGRCKVLDASADGYVRAEGTAVVQMVDDAPASRYPCFLGSCINQDGKSSALTAPHGPSQQAVIRGALHSAALGEQAVVHLQMHGTGTALGDPIEMSASRSALRPQATGVPLQLSANKSQFGHTELAAGIFNIISSIANTADCSIKEISHLRVVNPYVATSIEIKDACPTTYIPRLAGVMHGSTDGDAVHALTALAFQGTNTHVVMSHSSRFAQRPFRLVFAKNGARVVQCIQARYTIGDSPFLACAVQVGVSAFSFRSTNGEPFTISSACKLAYAAQDAMHQVAPARTSLSRALANPVIPANLFSVRMARGRISIIAHALEHRSDVAFLATVARFAAPFRVRVAAGARKWTGFCTYQRACTLAKAAESRDLAHRTACVDQTGCARTPHRRLVGAGAIVASVDSAHDDPRAHRIVACGGEARVVNDGGVGALRICEATHHFPHRGGSGPAVSSSFDRACDSLYDTTWHASGAVRASQTAASGTSRASAHLASARALVSLCASAPARTLLGLFCSMQEPIPHPWLLALTRGAVHTHVPGASGCSLASAGMSAAIRSRHLETHDGAWSAVDVSAAANVSARALVCTIRHETAVTDAFSDATVTQSSLLVPVLRRRTMPARHASPLVSPVHHCITGGTGALGRMLASILTAAPTVASVATLLSRSGRGNKGFRAALGSAASTRSVWRASRCDAASIDEYACEVLARRRMPYGPPRISVAHAGGVLADAMLAKHNARSVRTVYAPKVDAAGHIEARAIPAPCVGVTAFSSIAVCIMSMGQANYAGANATLDAWVMRMRTTGVCAASTQWGAWSDVGMATTEKNILKRMERQGILPLPPDQGCLLMEMVIASSTAWMYAGCNASAKLTCTPMCWDTFARTVSSSRYFPVGEEGGVADAPKPTADAAARSAARSAAQGAPSASSLSARRMNIAGVQQAVSAVVQKVADDAIDDHAALMESGVDSLMSTEIRTEVERALSVSLPATVLFDYPTIAELAKYVAGLVGAIDEDCSCFHNSEDPALVRLEEAIIRAVGAIDFAARLADINAAASLQSCLLDVFGVSVSLSEICEIDSASACARMVQRHRLAQAEVVSRMQVPTMHGAHVICIPGVGRELSVTAFEPLVEALPESFRVTYAILPHGSKFADVGSVAEMLDAQVSESLGTSALSSPVFLIGHSFGGLIAHHWAVQLPHARIRPKCVYVSAFYANPSTVGDLSACPEAVATSMFGPSITSKALDAEPKVLDGIANDISLIADDAATRRTENKHRTSDRLAQSKIVALYGTSDPASRSVTSTSGYLAPYPFGAPRGAVARVGAPARIADITIAAYDGGHVPVPSAWRFVARHLRGHVCLR